MKTLHILTLLAIIPITAQSETPTKNAQTMNNQIIQKFNVVGISVRTTNENGQASKDLETLWGKFWGEEIQKQIPNKVNDDIYAVYTDYETDFTGAYTVIIGSSVSSLEDIPEGFVGITIEKGEYRKFVSKGKMKIYRWGLLYQNHRKRRFDERSGSKPLVKNIRNGTGQDLYGRL